MGPISLGCKINVCVFFFRALTEESVQRRVEEVCDDNVWSGTHTESGEDKSMFLCTNPE